MKKPGSANKWIYESHEIDKGCINFGFRVLKRLYHDRSKFQKIDVFKCKRFGRVLFLDGITQLTTADEFSYHEMISHLPLLAHPKPERVLIIGGGDGGALREVLKNKSVKRAVLVEIDKLVVEAAKKFLPSVSAGAFLDKRARLIIADAAEYVRKTKEKFDVVIVDSSDPIGPAKELFMERFYRNVSKILSPNGIAIYQSGLTFFQKSEIVNVVRRNKKFFKHICVSLVDVPSYLVGNMALVLASKRINPAKTNRGALQKRFQVLRINTRYYSPEIHFSSLVLPNYLKNSIGR